jgi:ribose 1,5-bisphosphokinase
MTRYAIYFAPRPDSPWWQAGCTWLGRDPGSGEELATPAVPGIPAPAFRQLTEQARRYGFHATLKAPFRLADGFNEEHLLGMAAAFAELQHPVALHDLQIRSMAGFLALRPAGPIEEIGALAMRCVSYFDNLRAASTAAELVKRRNAGLSQRQESLLQRWGYPYTEEEFRFHMTLTDSLQAVDDDTVHALRKAAEECFAPALLAGAPVIDALTIFREERPGMPFAAWKRFPFGAREQEPAVPASGRVFFLVGPSGVGKDTLLNWAEQSLPQGEDIVFARRTITRPPHASEMHDAVDDLTFWKLAASGHFSMIWQANGLCYGIPRGIEAELRAGRNVVINGSREYIPQLRQLFPDAHVIWVEADAGQIRRRIEARQREAGPALLRRLDRVAQFSPPDGEDVIRLDNSGPVEAAGKRLLEILAR